VQEKEFEKLTEDMFLFYKDILGTDLGSWLAGQFMQIVWLSREFPDYWNRWTSAIPNIEAVMGVDLRAMRQEILDDMINRPETKPGGVPV